VKAEESYEAESLLSAIHDMSEDLWCAGWRNDLEFFLWSALQKDGRWPSATMVRGAALRHLTYLAAQCDGWWVHCGTVDRKWEECGGRVFLPLDEWRALYASRVPDEG